MRQEGVVRAEEIGERGEVERGGWGQGGDEGGEVRGEGAVRVEEEGGVRVGRGQGG